MIGEALSGPGYPYAVAIAAFVVLTLVACHLSDRREQRTAAAPSGGRRPSATSGTATRSPFVSPPPISRRVLHCEPVTAGSPHPRSPAVQELCAGSGLAVGYTPASRIRPTFHPGQRLACPGCGLSVSTTSEYVNVRLVEHTR